MLTKDIDVFVNGSWCYPYLFTVPLNTLLSAIFLYHEFGGVIVVCYISMAGLLAMQYFSNNYLAKLQTQSLGLSDSRVAFIAQILIGIKSIKTRLLERLYADRINEIRAGELEAYSTYCWIKQICSSIYFNAGVIISSLVFMLAEKNTLELGKVFSTLALLGYIFNFSILYSNYAIEALYALKVFSTRIDEAISGPAD